VATSANFGGSPTTTTSTFDWGNSSYDTNGGANVSYQGHYTGTACLMSCHAHTMSVGGTVYQSNGTTTAANVQLGIRIDGNLTTTYSGTQGNFFTSASANWATAQIAVRNAQGTQIMPANPSANGNCNSCHGSANRITVP
jgi:hypothetical protein